MWKGYIATAIVIAVGAVAASFWFDRTGTFSHANYQRIRPGMTVAEVERLLGATGAEVQGSELPGVVASDVPVGHPKRIKPVVVGERYLRWDDDAGYIVLSLRGGVVAEKSYWEPSL